MHRLKRCKFPQDLEEPQFFLKKLHYPIDPVHGMFKEDSVKTLSIKEGKGEREWTRSGY